MSTNPGYNIKRNKQTTINLIYCIFEGYIKDIKLNHSRRLKIQKCHAVKEINNVIVYNVSYCVHFVLLPQDRNVYKLLQHTLKVDIDYGRQHCLKSNNELFKMWHFILEVGDQFI